MPQGTVKKINEKGFGFIDYGAGKDVFFHVSGLKNREDFDGLQPGDRVQFETEHGEDDRLRAIAVVRVA